MPYKDKEQQRAAQLAWLHRRRQGWIDSQGGACVQCGSTERLEVDHIDPEQKLCNPGLIWSRNAEFREAELAKCQVLCYECHLIKTNDFKAAGLTHGDSGYCNKKNPCRCTICIEGHRQAKIDYRNRKRAAGLPYK